MRVANIMFLASMAPSVVAFVAPSQRCGLRPCSLVGMKMTSESLDSRVDRGTLIRKVAAGLLGTAVVTGANSDFRLVPGPETLAHAAEIGTEGSVVAVVGAGGKTGKLAVEGLLRRGKAVKAVTRTGDFAFKPAADSEGVLSTAAGDVTKIDTLKEALTGCGAVLFCASASKKGGNPEAVDYRGLLNTAQACVDLGIPRLVVISSGALTKPNSVGYKFTNFFGNIMDFKRKAELEVEALYAKAPAGLTFTFVRPGGLTDGPPIGPKGIELNQGDDIGGTVNRADVAEVVVEAVLSPATANTLFEVYDKKTSGPLQSGLSKPSGYELSGDTYESMFKGLKQGVGL